MAHRGAAGDARAGHLPGLDQDQAVVEAPDEAAAAAVLIGAVAAGHLKARKTTALLTAVQAAEAMLRAGQQGYEGPGRADG